MRDDEIGEMGRLLDLPQRLGRSLKTAEEIHDRARDQEFRRQVVPEAVPPSLHGAEKVHQDGPDRRSEEHTSELQSLMRISYAVFCLKKKKKRKEETA